MVWDKRENMFTNNFKHDYLRLKKNCDIKMLGNIGKMQETSQIAVEMGRSNSLGTWRESCQAPH